MKDRRIGQFQVSMDLIERSPESVAKMLSLLEFVPLKVESQPWCVRFEYIGISPLFEFVDLGCEAPEYTVAYDLSKNTINVRKGINLIMPAPENDG